MTPNLTIGIIAGSGPEAGIDLWQKVLATTRDRLGSAYRGDIDAPRVVLVSEPQLGASMDLPASDGPVWEALEATAREIADRCDVYAIACNTLNVYADRLRALDLGAELVAFPDAVDEWARTTGIARMGLLGARPVAELGEWSPYRPLAERHEIVTPLDPEPVHALIEAIKLDGGADPDHGRRLARIARELDADHVVLACTELPIVARPIEGVSLVDVTDLVANVLVSRVVRV